MGGEWRRVQVSDLGRVVTGRSLCYPPAGGGLRQRTIQEFLGHKNVRTTMTYTHVLNRGAHGVRSSLADDTGVRSPLDA